MSKSHLLPSTIPVCWSAPTNVCAATTTKYGGFSECEFSSFNLGGHVGDTYEHVQQNRLLLTSLLELPADIQWLNQVHAGNVIVIDSIIDFPPTADAAYTSQVNVPLAILTADCLPILLSNDRGTEIAAIHGGWRPLAANIIANTLIKFDSKPEQINAWLGPCIGPAEFEVGEEVLTAFTVIAPELSKAFELQPNGKYLADLHSIAKHLLNSLGITKVSSLADCTYLNADKYFSYRREGQTGRMASVICIKK